MFCRKGILINFVKFTGKHLWQSHFLRKKRDSDTGAFLWILGPATLLKKRPLNRYFPVNFAKFLRTPFFTEHVRWLLLEDFDWYLLNCFRIDFLTELLVNLFQWQDDLDTFIHFRCFENSKTNLLFVSHSRKWQVINNGFRKFKGLMTLFKKWAQKIF